MKIKDIYLYTILALSAYIYILARAFILPVSIDEAGTFFYYINTDNFIPFSNNYHWTANNHILNSAIAWLGVKIFGVSQLSLRIGSVLFFIPYLIYIYLFSKKINSLSLKWVFRFFFISATALIEFFCISRGYGISLACVLGAFYHLQKYLHYKKTVQFIICVIYISLASVANLNSILLFAMIIFCGLLFFAVNFKQTVFKEKLIMLVVFILSSWVFIYLKSILDKLKSLDELMHGSDIENINQLFDSLVSSLYLTSNKSLIYYIIAVILLFTVTGWLYLLFKRKKIYEEYNLFIFFIASIMCVVFLKYYLHINLPKDRTTIQLFFILMLSFYFVVNYLELYIKKTIRIIYILPCILILYSLLNINIKHPNFNFYSYIPAAFYQYISEHYTPETTISAFENCDMIWGIHNIINKKSIAIQQTDFPNKDCDYIISKKTENNHYLLNTNEYKKKYTQIFSNNSKHGYVLYKRKSPVILKKCFDKHTEINNFTNNEYINLCDTVLSSENYNIYTQMDITSKNKNIFSWFVIDVSDTTNTNLLYEYCALDRLSLNYKKAKRINISFNLCKPKISRIRIKAYIWNIKQQDIMLKKAKIKFSIYTY